MTTATDIRPGEVWQYREGNGGQFASINRPFAGARFERDLPSGRHPFQLYSLATPNGVKVTILFEELLALGYQGAEYDAWRIDIGAGDQFGSGFTAINPNGKIPALLDQSDPEQPIRLFESGAILLYLADKFGAFLPKHGRERAETLNWLFWQMGAGPFLGGGFGHFFAYAPARFDYALDRFAMEAKRHLDLLDKRLAEVPYLAGESYSIADIAAWPWYGQLARGRSYEGAEVFLDAKSYPRLMEWAERIAQRPAVKRGKIVNKTGVLDERHSAEDIDRVLDSSGL
ncbi:glutathione-dependent disulfide-bond oxidoreductase [Sphingomonas sp. HDW15A]|uniref:glutathione-dependent disulfide-bond oxidoreductase n=1 Tax=Sphingomonas sp. HDW15A TaxID=2714942 RepID=UPI00140BFEB8|nr:glutathione-dependent disulfide-bond oxidoreductase [Sphingomonas sp. HDW15A]QIK95133.1 glutathione-dependent disulfide-bond oxidoreductase [Sphingomonas sp. HDW15A]